MRKIIIGMLGLTLTFGTFGSVFASELSSSQQEEKYIVTFKDKKVDEEVIEEVNGEVTDSFTNVPIVAAELTNSEVNELKQDSNLIIEEDTLVEGQSQRIEWGIKQVKADQTWQSGYTGKNIKVAILDTGVGPNDDVPITAGASFVSYTTSWNDDNGHGTHVAGVVGAKNNDLGVVGVAPNTQIFAGKVLDKNSKGYTSQVIAGIDWAISNKVDIINLSLKSGDTTALREAVKRAYNSGILLVAASGNGSVGTVDFPARYPEVIAVGSTDTSNNLSYFSNYGQDIEVVAPGQSIVSSYTLNRLANLSGTSMASPHVAGVLALLKEANPSLSPVQIRELLQKQTVDLGDPGKDVKYGYGLVNGYVAPPVVEKPKPVNPTPPAQPALSKAWHAGGKVHANWKTNTEKDLAGYNVYAGNVKVNTSPVVSAATVIDSLQKGRSYYIHITAVDTEGSESIASKKIFVMVPL